MTTQNTQRCKACNGSFLWEPNNAGCCCAEGAKVDRGAELRYKESIGQCYEPGCVARADVDGWCDDHSVQFKQYGTHCAVGWQGHRP